ncbi:MAG: response regulator [Enhygromyxa sp.]
MDRATPISMSLRARSGPVARQAFDRGAGSFGVARALTRPQALIVDDCRFIAERVARTLEARGFDCLIAGDGYAGLKLTRHCRFDLFVLDVDMPYIDGFSLLRQLRDDPVHADALVLILAAEPSELDRARALELGASGYMTKPLQLRPLNAMVDSMMG